jgi:hypothetical protein
MQVPSTITVVNSHNNENQTKLHGFMQDETFPMDIPDKLTG